LVRRRRNPLWTAYIVLLLWTVITLWYHIGAPKWWQKHSAG
jgi:hypothetical protein